ncbi:MAG: polysaccharide biosynthesis protein, partial [Syntrophus sp. (in: bacteria)]
MVKRELLSRILKRSGSMFAEDLEVHRAQIEACIRGARIMVIGAAGSIGSAFVRQLVSFRPAALHMVDISENNLVEVVRDLRSALISLPEDFKTFAVAMGSLEFDRLLDAERASDRGGYDYVINFSALKHVRSEKDPFSLMRMVHTNVVAVKALLDRLVGTFTRKHFSVSSDKAANPANIMGATKIFMERVLLTYADRIPFSTARFANVAFSDGSLLHGFLQRLAKGQPFAAPYDVRRYFISHEEAGQLCLLSCFLGENRDIYFPKLDEGSDLLTFAEIAVMVLEA